MSPANVTETTLAPARPSGHDPTSLLPCPAQLFPLRSTLPPARAPRPCAPGPFTWHRATYSAATASGSPGDDRRGFLAPQNERLLHSVITGEPRCALHAYG